MGAEGTDCTNGEDILLADEPSEFADAIVRVLSDGELAARLTANARKLVEDQYSWKAIGKQFVDLVERTRVERRAR